MKKKKEIVEWDIDEATYIGDGNDGAYYQVGEHKGKWYVTCVVDSETGAFVDTFVKDDGPYDSEKEAIQAGKNCAYEWCINNGVNWEYICRICGEPVEAEAWDLGVDTCAVCRMGP